MRDDTSFRRLPKLPLCVVCAALGVVRSRDDAKHALATDHHRVGRVAADERHVRTEKSVWKEDGVAVVARNNEHLVQRRQIDDCERVRAAEPSHQAIGRRDGEIIAAAIAADQVFDRDERIARRNKACKCLRDCDAERLIPPRCGVGASAAVQRIGADAPVEKIIAGATADRINAGRGLAWIVAVQDVLPSPPSMVSPPAPPYT